MLKKKRTILVLIGLLGFCQAKGQYYYQDLHRTLQTNEDHQQYRTDGVHQINIASFDAQQQPSPGFKCIKSFSPDYRRATTTTQSFSTGKDVLISDFDQHGRVVHTVDSSVVSIAHTYIHYNEAGHIDSMVFLSYATDKGKTDSLLHFKVDYQLRETHAFTYDSSGRPTTMVRLKNGRSYATIYFATDSAGHVFKEYQKQGQKPVYYYKYQGDQLTDIFHYSRDQKRMIPNYLLDYDSQGRLLKKTVVLAGSSDYLVWQYSYNNKGQISQQRCFNKEGALQGRLVFRYQ